MAATSINLHAEHGKAIAAEASRLVVNDNWTTSLVRLKIDGAEVSIFLDNGHPNTFEAAQAIAAAFNSLAMLPVALVAA